MTNYSIHRKIGTPYIFDRTTGLDICLPAPFQIIHYHQKSWNGGSIDGNQYLHIDRIRTEDGAVPTIIAEGDLNLFLASTTQPEQIDERTRGVEVAGTISDQEVKGYIAVSKYDENYSYLVFVAAREGRNSARQRENAIAIAALTRK